MVLFFNGHGAPDTVLNVAELVSAVPRMDAEVVDPILLADEVLEEVIRVTGATVEVLRVDLRAEVVVATEVTEEWDVLAAGPDVDIGIEVSLGPAEIGTQASGNLNMLGSFNRSWLSIFSLFPFFTSFQAWT